MCSTGGKTRRTYFTLDGGRSNPGEVDIFRTRPDRLRGPPSLQSLFPGGKAVRAWRWPPTPHVAVRLKSRHIPLLPVWVFTACSRVNFTFYLLRTSHTHSAAAQPTSHQCAPGTLAQGHEAKLSRLFNAKVKNEWRCTSNSAYMADGPDRYNFTLLHYFTQNNFPRPTLWKRSIFTGDTSGSHGAVNIAGLLEVM